MDSEVGYILSKQKPLMGHADAVGFGSACFHVREIPRDTANAVIKKNHYSGTVVSNTYVHLGIFIDSCFRGVLQFGYAMNPSSGGTIVPGTANKGYLELNRMWLDDIAPRNSESRAISCAIKYIKRKHPSVRWIQSFADERCGRLGVVYQAANFSFYGKHRTDFYMLDGEAFHKITMTSPSKGGSMRRATLMAGGDRIEKQTLDQFRYIYWVDKSEKEKCKLREQPYPKHGVAA